MSAPTSLMTAGSFGKMPTTSERRLISRLSRSSGFVEAIWTQCSRGKAMYTSTSSREPSIRSASLGKRSRKASATEAHCARAASAVSWAKIVFSRATTAGRCFGCTCASALRIQCTRQRSNQRHTAGCPAFEVRITYPFHPRSGEMVAVVGSKRHAGADHLVIRQPDRTLTLLPVWMTEPAAPSPQLVSSPRLSIESLAEVRALVDVLLASSGRESSRRKGAGDAERTTQPKGSVRREGDGSAPAARASGQADPASADPSDGGGRRRPAGQDDTLGRSGGRR